MGEVGEDYFSLNLWKRIVHAAAVVDNTSRLGNEGESQNHLITSDHIENCSVESMEDDIYSIQPRTSYLLEDTATICLVSEGLIQCSPHVEDKSQAKLEYERMMKRLEQTCGSGATLVSLFDEEIFDDIGSKLACFYICTTLKNVLKDFKNGTWFEEHQVQRMLIVGENSSCDFVRKSRLVAVLRSGQQPYMCELYEVENDGGANTVIIDCPVHVKCLQFYRKRGLLSPEKYDREVDNFVKSVQEYLKGVNLQQYCAVARSIGKSDIHAVLCESNTDSQSGLTEETFDCVDGTASSPSVVDRTVGLEKNYSTVRITTKIYEQEAIGKGCAVHLWSIRWPVGFSPSVSETTSEDVLLALLRSRLISERVHQDLVSYCGDVDKKVAKSANFSESHIGLLSLLTMKLLISIISTIKDSNCKVYDALRMSPYRKIDEENDDYRKFTMLGAIGNTNSIINSERDGEKQLDFKRTGNSTINLDNCDEKQLDSSVSLLQLDGELAAFHTPLSALSQGTSQEIDDQRSRVEDAIDCSSMTSEHKIKDEKHSTQSCGNLEADAADTAIHTSPKRQPVSSRKHDKKASQSMGLRVTGGEDAAAVADYIERREPIKKSDKHDTSTSSSSQKMKAKSNQNNPDKQKTTEIIKNLLFVMVEDKKYLPFDFEQQLRRGALEHGIDVAQLRNKNGCTLLHCAVIESRTPFILPIFRVGCWNAIRPLRVEMGKNCPFEGKTADEIAMILRQRKVQKELDTCTAWEKSLNVIHVSARVGNLEDVRKWLEYSSDLHTELDSMNCSTLYWACIGGNLQVVLLLLNLGVDFTQVNSRKETLLHAASIMSHSHLIETLMTTCKQDVTLKDSSKKSAILRVSENGDEKSLAKFIECGMKKDLLSPMLAIAGHYGRLNFLRTVIEKYGIPPQSKDEAGKSAYIRASEQGRVDVLRYYFSKDYDFAETDQRKRNVLHAAADGAPKEVMIYLMNELKQRGVNIKHLLDARDKYIGGELCMLIRGKDKGRDSWHYVEVSRGLMDIFMKRTRGGTIDVVKYGTLLQSGWGIDPDEKASNEIEKRFETRRNTTSVNDADVTPLHIAVFKDKPDVVDVLLENGADVNARDKFKMTPLHIAAMRGNITIMKRLIDNGASTECVEFSMKSPADVAEDNEHPEAVSFLKSVKYLPAAEAFRNRVLPNVTNLLSAEHLSCLHDSGVDIRRHLINTLRDLMVDINETLLAIGSGPVLEESTNQA